MWINAALWQEPQLHKEGISPEVVRIAGKSYAEYAMQEMPEYMYTASIAQTNMIDCGGAYSRDISCGETPYIIYDFGRTVIGYKDIMYSCDRDTQATMHYDFSERISYFDLDPKNRWAYVIDALAIKQKLKSDETSAFNLRRRAFRYLKIEFEKECEIQRSLRRNHTHHTLTKAGISGIITARE